MTIDERIKKYFDKYWITISYDLTLYVKDHRYTRYKICFPKIVMNPDGTYDLDLKDQDVTMNVKGRDISYHMAKKRRLYPDYFKILEETVKRKEAEWKAKQGDANV